MYLAVDRGVNPGRRARPFLLASCAVASAQLFLGPVDIPHCDLLVAIDHLP